MIKNYAENKNIVLRLTYLWAFTEGGLGGLLHLLHIPLTGFIVGGISAILNVFIASYSRIHVRSIVSSLGLVLLCKFTLSPQSPLGSYIAVSFQALLSIIIFKLMGINRLSILMYTVLVMLENAVQKPFMAYIIFGDQLIKGILLSATKFFKDSVIVVQFWNTVVIFYLLIYSIWGAVIAHWSHHFLSTIEQFKLDKIPIPHRTISEKVEVPKNQKKIWLMLVLSIIFYFLFVYFTSTKAIWPLYAVRIIMWFILMTYFLPYLVRRMLSYMQQKKESTIMTALTFMPGIKQNFYNSLELVKEKNGLEKIKYFLFFMIYLNVFYTTHES